MTPSDSISSLGAITSDTTTGTGVVTWYNATKGFAFVSPTTDTDNHKTFFCHVNTIRSAGLVDTLIVGTNVSYTLVTTQGRSVITDIALISGNSNVSTGSATVTN